MSANGASSLVSRADSAAGLERRGRGEGTRKPETRFERLFDVPRDGIVLVDEGTGHVIDVNPFVTRLLGLSYEQLVGKEFRDLRLMREDERSRAASPGALDPSVSRQELLVKRPWDPDAIHVEVVRSRYHDGDRWMNQFHFLDITERRRADLNARRQALELESADRHKNEFLAMLSHELRNAIAPVTNALQVLRLAHVTDTAVPGKAHALIERQMRHLSHLVSDLQDMASVASGQMRLQCGPIDLREVVQRAVEGVMAAFAHCQHQVSVAIPPEPIWMNADAVRMEQVVVNLVSNAAKYTPDGGRIAIIARRDHDRAELRVTDSGIGIAPEMLPRVFDLFAREETARVHSRTGLGIGLNVVKRIVELHGGSVVARSAGPGAGSEFIVSLPLTTSAA